MARVYISTWQDNTHAEGNEDEGKQWVAEVVEDIDGYIHLDLDPETFYTFGWYLTENEAVAAAVEWLEQHPEHQLRA